MDAVMFLKERARMCNSVSLCSECPIGFNLKCSCTSDQYTDCEEEAVSLVEEWSSEHPQKTMLQDFLEKFPNAPLQSDGTPSLCPYKCGYTQEDYCKKFNPNPAYKTCLECWSRPLEG